eukprot:scaffold492241_cov41-Prasinocladus_malaysianus.AAC.1
MHELSWQGSTVITLTEEEQVFLYALRGDAHGAIEGSFEAMETQLRKEGSSVALHGPRCSLSSKKIYSDAAIDQKQIGRFRLLTYIGMIDRASGGYLAEGSKAVAIAVAIFAIPVAILASNLLVSVTSKTARLSSSCPACGSPDVTFEVEIGPAQPDTVISQCPSCLSNLKMNSDTLLVELMQDLD